MKESDSYVHRIAKMIRCTGITKNGFKCNKLITKLVFMITAPQDWEKKELSISNLFKDLEVKVATETKCGDCKHMTYALTVL